MCHISTYTSPLSSSSSSSSIKQNRKLIMMMTTTKPSRNEVARAYAVLKAAKTNLIAKAAKRKFDKYWQSMHCEEEEPTTPIYVPTTPGYRPSSPCYVPSMPCYCPWWWARLDDIYCGLLSLKFIIIMMMVFINKGQYHHPEAPQTAALMCLPRRRDRHVTKIYDLTCLNNAYY